MVLLFFFSFYLIPFSLSKCILGYLTSSHTFGDSSLQSQFSFSVIISTGFFNFQSLQSVRQSSFDLVLSRSLQFSRQDWVSDSRFNRGNVSFQFLFLFVSLSESIIRRFEFFSIRDHLFNFFSRQSTNRVGDSNVSRSTSGFFNGSDFQDTVSINFKDSFQDWFTGLHWWDVLQVEFTQQGVFRTVDTFTLVDWELNSGLVVSNSGEGSSLDGWDSGVSWNNWGKNVTLHSNTKRQWNNIQQQQVFGIFVSGLTSQDSTLDGSTVSNSFIWVNGFFQLFTVKEVRQQFLDLWNSGRTTNQDNFVNLALVDLSILQNLFNWFQSGFEQSRVDVFESSSGNVSREIFTFKQGVNFNSGLSTRRQGSLGSFTSSSQSSQSSGITRDIQTSLFVEFFFEVFQQVGIEILTTQVSVTSSGFDSENTTSNVQQGNIESTTTQIEDQDVSFFFGFTSTQTVSNGSGGWFVNDSQNVQTSNGTSIFGSLSLSIIEVSWDSNNSLFNFLTNLGFSNFLHLGQDHGGNFLWREGLGFVQVLNFNLWLTVAVNNFEWPGFDIFLNRFIIESSTD
ncbi:heat shock protein SSB1 [Candida tropicalis MYA-3404]|uniref:Heat shock protein SSB1 n=1 Tax=Candida tropicalis (strain ATCC MYA-3404 / T1) TaxID=294747 RepID=C5MAL6_CANTT|nr:heat shock protein SSB1 [Candida tropicalis MYA-3404]EER32683.1 heat shock protein SSB1 [Candida tropicalis MYA-3404]KAG4406509.1 hypothetical protein JTP64_003893 [Candida tropicalis]